MIRIRDISKEYVQPDGRKVVALNHISLTIEDGEIFGIIGLSGAGKSTLLRSLNRLEEPSSGEVFLACQNMNLLSKRELNDARKKIGMIFQHFNLFSARDVARNVAYPLEIAGWRKRDIHRRVTEMLDLVGLSDKAKSYPSQLSGGQKQRVAIARALSNGPNLLLCDEATSALDPFTTKSILELLAHINESLGITVVLITHEMNVIREICHRVAILEDGNLVECGAVKEVFLHPQSETARKFLADLPRTGYSVESFPRTPGATLAILRFDGKSSESPVISKAVRRSRADINILAGEIDQLYSSKVGNLTVEISGPREAVDETLRFIRGNGVKVEVIWNG